MHLDLTTRWTASSVFSYLFVTTLLALFNYVAFFFLFFLARQGTRKLEWHSLNDLHR